MTDFFRIIGLTAVSGFALAASFFKWFPALPYDIAWVAIIVSGTPIVYGAIKGLLTRFDVTADVLVAIALVASVAIGEWFAAGEVAFIMQLGKALEDVTAGKSRKSLEALIRLTPQKACLRLPDGEKETGAADLKRGDILLVRPGETIPVDGIIVRGSTSVNQAVMTGESVPVDKEEGDAVWQGTLNLQGAVDIKATTVGEDSSLKKMIRLVGEAERNKAPVVRIADRWARILVPVALGCSLAILFLTKDIYRAVTALVVFCPCSLILATPTAMMAAIGNATQKGILVKSGAAVEAISKIDTLVMDKTGTLTYGKLRVEEIALIDPEIDRADFVKLIAGAEKFSEHPLGRAVAAFALEAGIAAEDPSSFETLAGMGVTAVIGGHEICIGEKIIGLGSMSENPEAARIIGRMQNDGKTALPVARDGKILGIISVADTLRKEAPEAIAGLKRSGLARIVMLTGDNRSVADSVGRAAGITDIYASQLPEDKVLVIGNLAAKGYRVGMLGDGVNDAPALAAASVGIVMGAIGSDAAIEAADVALMGDDVGKLPFLVSLCRKTGNRIAFNIALSMIVNFGAMILAGFGLLNPVTAALVHNCGSVFVVVNSATLLAYRESPGKLARRGFFEGVKNG